MSLTPEQIKELKDQLIQQVQHLPPQQKAQAEDQIENLSPEALEAMLQQERSKNPAGNKSGSEKTIFRSIAEGNVLAIVVEENASAIAVMDIAPISKGHVLIIPRAPVTDAKNVPLKVFTLAKRVAKRISKAFKSKETSIHTENKFGETVLHVIPSYVESKDLNSPRSKASKEDLEKIASSIRIKKRKPRVKKIKTAAQESPQRSSPLAKRRRVP